MKIGIGKQLFEGNTSELVLSGKFENGYWWLPTKAASGPVESWRPFHNVKRASSSPITALQMLQTSIPGP
ncbi:hypothetical protein VTI28DRAFT_8489 [Corynascus sepedonium]